MAGPANEEANEPCNVVEIIRLAAARVELN